MGVPGTAASCPSVLLTARSTVGVRAVVSVAELFAALVSVNDAGGTSVAVLDNTPVASAAIVAVTRNETVPPAPTSRSWATWPAPAGLLHVEPGVAAHVHVAPESVTAKVSFTATRAAAEGPPLLTTTVYEVAAPGTADVRPSVLVIDRSPR